MKPVTGSSEFAFPSYERLQPEKAKPYYNVESWERTCKGHLPIEGRRDIPELRDTTIPPEWLAGHNQTLKRDTVKQILDWAVSAYSDDDVPFRKRAIHDQEIQITYGDNLDSYRVPIPRPKDAALLALKFNSAKQVDYLRVEDVNGKTLVALKASPSAPKRRYPTEGSTRARLNTQLRQEELNREDLALRLKSTIEAEDLVSSKPAQEPIAAETRTDSLASADRKESAKRRLEEDAPEISAKRQEGPERTSLPVHSEDDEPLALRNSKVTQITSRLATPVKDDVDTSDEEPLALRFKTFSPTKKSASPVDVKLVEVAEETKTPAKNQKKSRGTGRAQQLIALAKKQEEGAQLMGNIRTNDGKDTHSTPGKEYLKIRVTFDLKLKDGSKKRKERAFLYGQRDTKGVNARTKEQALAAAADAIQEIKATYPEYTGSKIGRPRN